MTIEQGRVLYCVRKFGGFSGGRLSPVDWLSGLAAMDERTTILSESPRTALPEALQNDARLSWAKAFPRFLPRILNRPTCSDLDPEVMIVEGRNGHRLANHCRVRGRRANAVVVRGVPEQYSVRVAGEDRISQMRSAIAASDTVIFNSPRVRQIWETAQLVTDKRCLNVPNSAREDVAEALRARGRADVRRSLGFRPDALVLVCVASLQYRKGQDLLLDAWPEISGMLPEAELHLVGPTLRRGEGAKLSQRASNLPGVVVAGPHRDAMAYIYAADLLVLPSRGESMPRVILEAMSLGTAVCATQVGAISDMVDDGRSGFLVDVDDRDAMAAAILKLGRSQQLRKQAGKAAREKYEQQFSRKIQQQKIGAAVETMLNLKSAPEAVRDSRVELQRQTR